MSSFEEDMAEYMAEIKFDDKMRGIMNTLVACPDCQAAFDHVAQHLALKVKQTVEAMPS